MRTFLATLHGAGLGAVIGAALGLFVGELAVDFFNVSSFEGAAGYAIVFIYAPAGLLLGAIFGGVMFYNNFWPNFYIRLGLHIVAAILLVWLVVKLTTE